MPSTPPNSSTGSALSKTTPLKPGPQGSQAHSSSPQKKASVRYKEMTRDACEKFVGPMAVDTFLSEFIPRAPEERPINEFNFSHNTVSQNEDAFIHAVEASGLSPKLKFINTTHRPDGPYNLKPDISIYSDDLSDEVVSQRSLDWKTVDLWVENKNNRDDIFRTLEEMQKVEETDDLESHIKWTNSAYKVCGQLVAYASALHCSQFRVFSFAIALFGERGRLLRWDRSGVIYTKPFNWMNEPDTLFEFIWRLNFLSNVHRGFDTTVTSVEDDEAEVAMSKLRTHKGLENVQSSELLKFLVHDDRATDGQVRWYITPGAIWHTEALFGRSTFGYIAYDVETSNLVYLKDYWRTDLPGIEKEGDVYRELHGAQVPNIPILGPAGDVPLSPDHASALPFSPQRTRTQDYLKGSGHGHEWCPGRPHVDPYVHYRLVLETLGQPLNTFKSTRQLCEVIRDAIVAHTLAYERTHILHRDVSAGNLLITEGGSGILIDWDLSKKVIPDVEAKPRQHSRTGTWQFISIARLIDPSTRPHEVSDDLESFFWVLLYLVVKCRNATKMDLSEAMRDVFDQHTDMDSSGNITGGKGKLSCLGGNADLGEPVVYSLVKTPCGSIIEEFRELLHDFYLYISPQANLDLDARLFFEAKREGDSRVKEAKKKLCSSEWVLGMINQHLASKWDVDDDGSLHKSELCPGPSASRSRRKRKAPDSNEERQPAEKMRKGRLPPSESMPPGESIWSQRPRGFESGTLGSISSRGATRSSNNSSSSHRGRLRSGNRLR